VLELERRELLKFTQTYIVKYLDPNASFAESVDPSTSFLSSSSLSSAPQESTKEKVEFIIERLEERTNEVTHLCALLRETDASVRDLTTENNKLLSEINRLHEEHQKEYYLNLNSTENYNARVAKWEQTIVNLSKEKAQKEEEIAILIEELAQNTIEKMALSEYEIELKNNIYNLNANYQSAMTTTANYKAEIDSLKANLSKNSDTIWLKNENAHLKSEYNSIADELNIANEKLKESNTHSIELKNDCQTLANKLANYENELKHLNRLVEKLEADNSRLVEEIAAKKEFQHSDREVLEMKRKYAELSEKNDLLIDENRTLSNNLNKLFQDTLKMPSNNYINEHKNTMAYLDAVIGSVNSLAIRLNGSNIEEKDEVELFEDSYSDLTPQHDDEHENPAFGLLDENDQLNNSLEAMLFDREYSGDNNNNRYQDDPIVKHNDVSYNSLKEQQQRKRILNRKLAHLSDLVEKVFNYYLISNKLFSTPCQ
jgi:chromosome segregation ATPase